MSQIYSPWITSEDEDMTEEGLVTPAYMEMQQGEAEPGEEMPGQPEEDTGSEAEEGVKEAMQMALQTINQQSSVIQSLMAQFKGA